MIPNFLNYHYVNAVSKSGINLTNKEVSKDLDDILFTRLRHDQEEMRAIAKMRSQLLESNPSIDFEFNLLTTPEYSVLHGHKHGSQTFLMSAQRNPDFTFQSINVSFSRSENLGPSNPSVRSSRTVNAVFSEKYTTQEDLNRLAVSRLKSQNIPLLLITRDPASLFFSGLTQALWAYDGKYYQNEFVKANPYIGKKLKSINIDFGLERAIKGNDIDFENQEVRDLYFAYFHYIISNYGRRLTGDVHLSQIDYCFKYTQMLDLMRTIGDTPLIHILNLDQVDSTPYLKKFLVTNGFVKNNDHYDVKKDNPRHSTRTVSSIVKEAFFESDHKCYGYFGPLADHLVRSINTFNLLYDSKNIVHLKANKNNRQTLGQHIRSKKL